MEDEVRSGCIQMCKTFHTGTRDLSLRYFNELERYNYVTPTSYLELINTLKKLLMDKKMYVLTKYHKGKCFSEMSVLFCSLVKCLLFYSLVKCPERNSGTRLGWRN